MKAMLVWTALMVVSMATAPPVLGHGPAEEKGVVTPSRLQGPREGIKLLDIRPTEAYLKEHVGGALSIPLSELSESRLVALRFSKKDRIVIYGHSETPAKRAKMLLEVMEYTDLRVLTRLDSLDNKPDI